MSSSKITPGATVTTEGVQYSVWAPTFEKAEVVVHRKGAAARPVALHKGEDGYHTGLDREGRAGDAYGYRLNNAEKILPDPASRAQAESVHGLSLVVDPHAYNWSDGHWKRPRFRDLSIYELHVGTFTPEGTFRAAIGRLPDLKALGVTAIELMPLADFPGERNWGYDGVLIYAPARCYGSPDDLRALVDAAHERGLAVILDVVYNHFGPDGNYVSAFSPYYFHEKHHTPWGNGFNFDAAHGEPVRDFFRRNPVYWMEEFHIDGFRFDAAHEIQDDTKPHILAEMTSAIHERGGYAMAEDDRNSAHVVSAPGEGGLGFDGVWADDFHHTARVSLTAENHAYFQDYSGELDQLVTTLRDGWFYRGQASKVHGKNRGTPGNHLPPERFVHCISNHDQVGNRAFGERLNHITTPEAYRALSVLLCLTPYTPLFFMGQEWGASTPFQFFTDHTEDLGRKITQGRRKEFAGFPEFADPARREQIPDPQAVQTFENSKLNWEERENPPFAQVQALYQECLRLRSRHGVLRPPSRHSWSVKHVPWGAAVITFSGPEEEFLLCFDLVGKHQGVLPELEPWDFVLSSQEQRFGGDGKLAWTKGSDKLNFRAPEALVFRRRDF